jgi:acetyl-CoA C-acetyltransferase
MKPPLDILGLARTPFGKFRGALSALDLPTLGALAVDAALERAAIDPAQVDALYAGVGMIAAARLTPARQILLKARLPQETPSLAVDRACCSGMTAIGLAAKDIWCGEAECIVAGGAESLSTTPFLLPRAASARIGAPVLEDPLTLRSPVSDAPIAQYTSAEALRYGVSRADQDGWALASHRRYTEANARGFFDFERIAVATPNGSVMQDEQPRPSTSLEKLASLATVHGSATITAGNAPGLNDGAAFILLARGGEVTAPLARLHDYVQVAEGPTSGAYTPAIAIAKLLVRNGLSLDQLQAIEINEAFAATPLVSALHLAERDEAVAERLLARTNVNGGAVALGHPLGASGARVVMTLVNRLRETGGGWGVAAICGGFGQGDAVLVKV